MAKLPTAQPKFKILVANLAGGSDPSQGINPTKIRTGFEQQLLPEVSRSTGSLRELEPQSPGINTNTGLLTWSTATTPVAASGTLTVISNDFTDAAVVYLGPYTITSNVDFTPGGNVNATATAIAGAINGLEGFTASALGAVVTVSGPFGLVGGDQVFRALFEGAFINYTLSPTNGYLSGAEPYIGPPDLL